MNSLMEKMSPIIVDGILTPIVKYLHTKGVAVTTAELASALQLPTQILPPPPIPVASSSSIAASSSETPAVKRERVKRNVQEVDPETHCTYVFTRKTKEYEKGQQCNKPCVVGQEFCPDCILRKQPVPKTKKEETNAVVDNKPTKKELHLQVIPIETEPGFFREVNHHFYMKRMEDNTIVVIAVFEDGDRLRPLTAAEKQVAHDLGIKIQDSE